MEQMCAQLNGGEVGRRCVHILVPKEVQLYPVGGSSGFYSHQGIHHSLPCKMKYFSLTLYELIYIYTYDCAFIPRKRCFDTSHFPVRLW